MIDMFALLDVEQRRTLYRKIVGFSGARGPDDFLAIGPQEVGNMVTCLFYQFVCMPAKWM